LKLVFDQFFFQNNKRWTVMLFVEKILEKNYNYTIGLHKKWIDFWVIEIGFRALLICLKCMIWFSDSCFFLLKTKNIIWPEFEWVFIDRQSTDTT
jgi:hypothetical protein